jgi:hypothetical protein
MIGSKDAFRQVIHENGFARLMKCLLEESICIYHHLVPPADKGMELSILRAVDPPTGG